MSTMFFGSLALPILCSLCLAFLSRKTNVYCTPINVQEAVVYSKGCYGVVLAAIFVFLIGAAYFQPQQMRRYQAEQAFKSMSLEQALQQLRKYNESSYPKHWVLPPKWKYGETKPRLPKIMEVLIEQDHRDWVHERYVRKFIDYFRYYQSNFYGSRNDELDLIEIVAKLPNWREVLGENNWRIDSISKIDLQGYSKQAQEMILEYQSKNAAAD